MALCLPSVQVEKVKCEWLVEGKIQATLSEFLKLQATPAEKFFEIDPGQRKVETVWSNVNRKEKVKGQCTIVSICPLYVSSFPNFTKQSSYNELALLGLNLST